MKFDKSRPIYLKIVKFLVVQKQVLSVQDFITECCGDAVIKLFADDVKMYCPVSNDVNIISDLSLALSNVYWWASIWQLRISIPKCAVLHLGSKNPKRSYTLNDDIIETVESFRDLGVLMSNNLKMSAHCTNISSKALQRVNIIFRAFSTRDTSILCRAYQTYVRPMVESSTTAWSPHLQKDITCVERVQRYFTKRLFLRCGLGWKSYSERCTALSLDSLELRRLRYDLVMCFRIVHGKIKLDCGDFFKFRSSVTRGHKFKLFVDDHRIDIRKYFFANRVVDAWNSLPEFAVCSSTVEEFKKRICNVELSGFITNLV